MAKKEIADHEAIPLSVREGPVDLNAENYRLQILRHNRNAAASSRKGRATGAPLPSRSPPKGG